MRRVVTFKEIEQILDLTDRLGLSREAIVIPLKPGSPGSVRLLSNGKFEIVVDAAMPLTEWLPELERRLAELGARQS